jgi:hypothetical protein
VKNEKAIAYLQSRGITAEAVQIFRLGYVDGSLGDKLNPDGKANLERLGLLNEKGNETMYGSVVFPLVDANSNQPTGLYARHLSLNSRAIANELVVISKVTVSRVVSSAAICSSSLTVVGKGRSSRMLPSASITQSCDSRLARSMPKKRGPAKEIGCFLLLFDMISTPGK